MLYSKAIYEWFLQLIFDTNLCVSVFLVLITFLNEITCITRTHIMHTRTLRRTRYRYKILAASQIKSDMTPEKCAQIIVDTAALDSEQYRLGKTKVVH